MKDWKLEDKIIPYCWVEDTDENGKITNKADALYEDETILIKDIKEFLRRLKDMLGEAFWRGENHKFWCNQIDNLAGKSLVESK